MKAVKRFFPVLGFVLLVAGYQRPVQARPAPARVLSLDNSSDNEMNSRAHAEDNHEHNHNG